MSKLEGRVALVTGASRGIGREVALRLASKGASLFIVADGTVDELIDVASRCSEVGGAKADWQAIDLSSADAAELMVNECLARFGRVDILVNNAGARRRKSFGNFTQQDYELVQGVNVRTPFFACQAVLPAMREQGSGSIINIGSQFGSVAFEEHALYGMTKAALIYLTRAIAYEYASSGIQVNCVSPGPTETNYLVERLAKNQKLRRKMENYVPLGRLIRPEEIAEAVIFLITSEGSAIHGHNLIVDGGWVTH